MGLRAAQLSTSLGPVAQPMIIGELMKFSSKLPSIRNTPVICPPKGFRKAQGANLFPACCQAFPGTAFKSAFV